MEGIYRIYLGFSHIFLKMKFFIFHKKFPGLFFVSPGKFY